MIASLRNGLAEGFTATRNHHTTAAVRYRSPRHITHLSSRTPDGLSWRVSGAVAFYPRSSGLRFISSRPPPTTGAAAQDIPHPVPSPSARKPKVDLRPGPVKPPKSSPDASPATQSAVPPNPAPESIPSVSPSKADVSAPSSSSAQKNSVIETAKEDLYDASKHGILAPPPENASWVGKLWHQGKELFKFYWNGVKLINTNRLRVREIEARVRSGGAPLSRWETRFIANFRLDALKLIPFVLIIIVAEEAIPLVVIYAPFILPSTCLLPSQKERIDNKRREKQKEYAVNFAPVFDGIHSRALSEPDLSVDKLLDRTSLLSYTGVLSLSNFGPPPTRLRRIKKHLKAISADDALLASENWGERLSPNELREALEERGIVTTDLSTEAMRARLQWWLAETRLTDVDPIRKRVQLVAANVIGQHSNQS